MKKIIVMNQVDQLHLDIPDVEIVSSKDYIVNPESAKLKNIRVFNLSGEYSYQSKGYYVSLLAEARGHKPIPSIKNIKDIKTPSLAKNISDDLEDMIQQYLKKIRIKKFVLHSYFGRNPDKNLDKLCHEFHYLFQVPFLSVKFSYKKKWIIQGIKTLGFDEIPLDHYPYVEQFAREYFGKKRYDQKRESNYAYDLAILLNPQEKYPPSNKKAITQFVEAGEKLGFYVELITKEDMNRLAEFDALFIRETTGVNHYTYLFARRAQNEGITVIDDPDSILRCCNKVYLTEVLLNAKLPMPDTVIVHRENKKRVVEKLGLPCVLKIPDSSFSRGVMLVHEREELTKELGKMLDDSDLVLAQEFIQSDFDWRIGFLDGKPLFACKYYMARNHWQIYNWKSKNKDDIEGEAETLPIANVPSNILESAAKAANLIGKGLYGVDLKENKGQVYIIEINDNPSIDAGVEDRFLQDKLYQAVLECFKQRIEQRPENQSK